MSVSWTDLRQVVSSLKVDGVKAVALCGWLNVRKRRPLLTTRHLEPAPSASLRVCTESGPKLQIQAI